MEVFEKQNGGIAAVLAVDNTSLMLMLWDVSYNINRRSAAVPTNESNSHRNRLSPVVSMIILGLQNHHSLFHFLPHDPSFLCYLFIVALHSNIDGASEFPVSYYLPVPYLEPCRINGRVTRHFTILTIM